MISNKIIRYSGYLITGIIVLTLNIKVHPALTVLDFEQRAFLVQRLDNISQDKYNMKRDDNSYDSYLQIINFALLDLSFIPESLEQAVSFIPDIENTDAIEPAVLGLALPYPNPFRFSDGTEIGYALSKDLEIEIHLYDMYANKIFKQVFPAGTMGGLGTPFYNRIYLNSQTINSRELSSGVYFFIFIHEGKVLGKGKMLVRP